MLLRHDHNLDLSMHQILRIKHMHKIIGTNKIKQLIKKYDSLETNGRKTSAMQNVASTSKRKAKLEN